MKADTYRSDRNRVVASATTFLRTTFKGFGQIMLQENATTGAFFLSGILVNSVTMGLAALLAAMTGTATATLLKYDREETAGGLYGFSAALTGVAMLLFFRPVLIVWLMVVAGAAAAAIIQHLFIKRGITVFTLPFVLVTWIALFAVTRWAPALLAGPAAAVVSKEVFFTFTLKGYGQVIFQNNLKSGMLFFLGVFISSPVAALYGLAGATLASIAGQHYGIPLEDVANGLLGFNAVLCAITFAGNRPRDGIWVTVSVLLSLIVSLLMLRNNLPQLTFPFVAASMVTMAVKKRYDSRPATAEASGTERD